MSGKYYMPDVKLVARQYQYRNALMRFYGVGIDETRMKLDRLFSA
jgi:hypothetical protein